MVKWNTADVYLFLALGVLRPVTASGHCQERPTPASPAPSSPSLHLSDTAVTDPERDLTWAVARGDLRFIGVKGFSLIVPSIEGGAWSRIVQIKGVNAVEGTSDGIASTEQARLQSLAFRYASRYNALLLARLRRDSDPGVSRVRQEIEAELTLMERGSPIPDARRAFHKGDKRLLSVNSTGNGCETPGLTLAQAAERPLHILAFSHDLTTEEQTQRMRKLLASYVTPYNRVVYQSLSRRRYF